jgi:hypothetical protein
MAFSHITERFQIPWMMGSISSKAVSCPRQLRESGDVAARNSGINVRLSRHSAIPTQLPRFWKAWRPNEHIEFFSSTATRNARDP